MTYEIDSKIISGMIALIMGIVGLWNWRSLAFGILKHLIRRQFPTVQSLTTQELAQWQNQKPQPLLLDARNAAEYQLSHIQQAQHIDPQQPDLSALPKSPETAIVVYCSVGYRSAKVAAKLAQAGYKHVYNLEGSIFQWVNEGRPVFQDNKATTQVHPYDRRWGQLLKSKHRAKLETQQG